MAQTRKKRRSKHRGTAAGTIESRGRTGRKLSEQERSKSGGAGARAARIDKPPTWQGAFYRALVACALLFVFTRLGLGPKVGIAASVALCLLALLMYVPLGYATDMFVYRRRVKRRAAKS